MSRLLKLIKSMRGLQKLIETLIFTLPSLMNVAALLFLVFFIYAVLGGSYLNEFDLEVFILRDVHKISYLDDSYNNFDNFGNALLILFRCSTGEDWPKIMYECSLSTGIP